MAQALANILLHTVFKRSSSPWIKERSDRHPDFRWQTGYAVFSLLSDREVIKDCIARQEDHHRNVTF